MTQEDKELLLRDLSARLPYGVKVNVKGVVYSNRICNLIGIHHGLNTYIVVPDGMQYHIESINPYLFPLSSMTEEQKNEYQYIIERWYEPSYLISDITDWLNKNHFDYRGLIEKGLAIDATGLNIY